MNEYEKFRINYVKKNGSEPFFDHDDLMIKYFIPISLVFGMAFSVLSLAYILLR